MKISETCPFFKTTPYFTNPSLFIGKKGMPNYEIYFTDRQDNPFL